MAKRPIIMSAWSVRAILAGRKTETRRPVKPQPDGLCPTEGAVSVGITFGVTRLVNRPGTRDWYRADSLDPEGGAEAIWGDPVRCPYGRPGDRLWVRETHAYITDPFAITNGMVRYRADGAVRRTQGAFPDGAQVWNMCSPKYPRDIRWRSPIHMPRWASRLTLRVEGVRVERVQEIDGPAALREGVEADSHGQARHEFSVAWDALWRQREPDFSWEANPWVWVVQFSTVDAHA